MHKKNILILLDRISRNSGGLSSILDLAEALHKLNHSVNLCIAGSSIIYRLRGSEKFKTTIPYNNICTIPKEFEMVNFDHSEDSNTNIKLNLVSVLKNIVKRIIIKIYDKQDLFYKLLTKADIIVDSADFTGKGFANIRRHTNACIIFNHSGSPEAFEGHWLTNEYLLNAVESKNERYLAFCRRYDALLFQGADQAIGCAERDPKLKKRSFVLPPSCQEDKVLGAKLLECPYNSERRAVVCVGSIQPRKAQHIAIKAFSLIASKYRDVDLHFVGDAPETDYVKSLFKLAEQLGYKDRIIIYGHRKDYLRFMAHADFIVQTSEEEGVSRILREAMLMKCPIISFAISGTKSLLEDGKEALLVEPKNVTAFAEAMTCYLDDPFFAKTLANAAYQQYLINNSWAAYASNLVDVIDDFPIRSLNDTNTIINDSCLVAAKGKEETVEIAGDESLMQEKNEIDIK